jgi:hypothetical protein
MHGLQALAQQEWPCALWRTARGATRQAAHELASNNHARWTASVAEAQTRLAQLRRTQAAHAEKSEMARGARSMPCWRSSMARLPTLMAPKTGRTAGAPARWKPSRRANGKPALAAAGRSGQAPPRAGNAGGAAGWRHRPPARHGNWRRKPMRHTPPSTST